MSRENYVVARARRELEETRPDGLVVEITVLAHGRGPARAGAGEGSGFPA